MSKNTSTCLQKVLRSRQQNLRQTIDLPNKLRPPAPSRCYADPSGR